MLEVRVYTPESELRSLRQLLAALWSDTFSQESRELAWRLFRRDLASQHRQSALGYLWILLPPLATSSVWVFLNSQALVSVPETGLPYPLYAFSGTLLWQSYAGALMAPLRIVQKEMAALTKVNFSREAVLLTGLVNALFSGALHVLILLAAVLAFNGRLEVSALLAPIAVAALVLLGFSIGILLTPAGLLFRDVGRAIPMVLRVWFFLTPVVYSIPHDSPVAALNHLNPVSPLLMTARNLATGTLSAFDWSVAVIIMGTGAALAIGLVIYRLSMPHIVNRMSA